MNYLCISYECRLLEKNAFAMSLATNHVPEAVMICFYTVAIIEATIDLDCSSVLLSPRIYAASSGARKVNKMEI